MKGLRNYIDKIKPNFEKGGKFEKFRSTFDAFETLLFVPDKVTFKGSHIRDSIDMKRTMGIVVLAVMPALLFAMWNIGNLHAQSIGETWTFWEMFGFGLLKMIPLIAVSYIVGLGIEFMFAQIRGHEVNEGFLVPENNSPYGIIEDQLDECEDELSECERRIDELENILEQEGIMY